MDEDSVYDKKLEVIMSCLDHGHVLMYVDSGSILKFLPGPDEPECGRLDHLFLWGDLVDYHRSRAKGLPPGP